MVSHAGDLPPRDGRLSGEQFLRECLDGLTDLKQPYPDGVGVAGRSQSDQVTFDACPDDGLEVGCRDHVHPVPLENRIRQVTCRSSGRQAARTYSLIRPLRTGFRRICRVSTLVTVAG